MHYQTADQLNADIAEWQQITQWQTAAKEKEMVLRQRLAKHIFANKLTAAGDIPKGTNKGEFHSGAISFKAKVVGKINWKVLEELRAATVEQLGQAGKELVKLKPELSVSKYNALTDEERAIADLMLVATPGAMELEIEILTEEGK